MVNVADNEGWTPLMLPDQNSEHCGMMACGIAVCASGGQFQVCSECSVSCNGQPGSQVSS